MAILKIHKCMMGQFGPIPTTALLQMGQLGLKKATTQVAKPLESAAHINI